MANSYVRYSGTGAQVNFSLTFPYLDQDHITAKVDGSTVSFSWVNATTVAVSPAPANGAVVELRRITPADEPRVDFQNGAIVTEAQLDDNSLQSLYVAAEDQDNVADALLIASDNVFDARSKRIKSVADPVNPQDAATKAYIDEATGSSYNDQAVAAAAEAAASAMAAAASLDAFDDRYLGSKSSAPVLDNDGNALVVGALYYDTALLRVRVWGGSSWTSIQSGITQVEGDARYVALAGSTMTGALTLPNTSPTVDNHAARKKYVDDLMALMFTTGDIKITWKTTADAGWIMHTDGTIGSATSGATYANAAAQALFLLLWANFADAEAPVVTGRGANAAADWAANKRITLPKALGRTIGVAGAGSGLTSRSLGVTAGAETHTHTGTTATTADWNTMAGGGQAVAGPNHTHTFTTAAGSSMPPAAFWNVMVKL